MAEIAPHSPPFRADHVGSLLRPSELLRAREEHDAGRLAAAQLRAVEDDLIRRVVAMHLCRGNNQSRWLTEGGYDPVAEMLFNRINVDSYFLEYDTSRAGTFEPLRFVPKNKTVVLGIVSSKLARLESKDELKRRIDQASKYIDPDQLGLSPQCGFASTSPGNRLTQEQQFAKLRRIVEVAREVWGQV